MNREKRRGEGAFDRALSYIGEMFGECLFPSNIYCIVCGKPVASDALYSMCDDCIEAFSWADNKVCSLCGRPLEDWYPDDLCGECKSTRRDFDHGISCTVYGEHERELIKSFKYHGMTHLWRRMSDIMADRLDAECARVDLIIPVPMYGPKEKKRGYNQASLLACGLAEKADTVYNNNVLIRVADTAPMNSLTPAQRRENISDAFKVTDEGRRLIAGKRVLLVDDIFTTGATGNECSRVLKAAGASEVWLMSFSSSRNQRILPELNMKTCSAGSVVESPCQLRAKGPT